MTKDSIIYIREHLMDNNPNAKFTIIADNMIYFRENLVELIWDDEREILWSLRQNQEVRENFIRPVQIQCTSYDMIQFIGVDFPIEMARKVCKDIGFDNERCMKFIDSLDLKKNPPL